MRKQQEFDKHAIRPAAALIAAGAALLPAIASATPIMEIGDDLPSPLPTGTTVVFADQDSDVDYDPFNFVGLTPGDMLDLFIGYATTGPGSLEGYNNSKLVFGSPSYISQNIFFYLSDPADPQYSLATTITVGASGTVSGFIQSNMAIGSDYCISIAGACTPLSQQDTGNVPIPGTLLLTGAGLLAAGATRRRRRHAR
tara:strand:+ start:3351 stop:3944 length:594 start_codon:yes stop_codon:yes gene_type:complete